MLFVEMDFSGVLSCGDDGPDFPAAWAIQRECGPRLLHHWRCSSVPGWDKISGPAFLCDCGAVKLEWQRQRAAAGEGPR